MMTDTKERRDQLTAELTDAIAAETAAADALEALEAAARQGVEVHPAELSEAAGTVVLRRMRREKLAADVGAAEVEAAEAERAEALGALAAQAAANPMLDHDRLRELEQAARATAARYREALCESERAFHDLVTDSRALDLPVVDKNNTVPDAQIAAFVNRTGNSVRYGDAIRVRLAGVEFAPPPSNLFTRFARWVADLG